MSLLPTTEKEAINEMLQGIGSAPVSTLEDSGNVDVVSALKTLRKTSREVQLKGWNFNTEECYPLTPSYPSLEISLPANCARVDAVDKSRNIVSRKSQLYDKDNHTYQFDSTVDVDMTLLFDFEELPETARNYITIKAVRKFGNDMLGDQALHQYKKEDEYDALVALQQAEGETGDYNMLTDSWSTREIVDRNI